MNNTQKSILIIEDDEVNAKLFVDIFTYCGYFVRFTSDYNETIELVESNLFDVILMDIQLAVFSGIDIIKRMRSKGITTPTVAITAFAVEGKEIKEIIQNGFNDCILKPTSIDKLTNTIKKYIQ